MKELNQKNLQEVRNWIRKNARPLELALWEYCFEQGLKERVIDLLTDYRNQDGGFGHALEPDLWNPESNPYTTLWAVNILRKLEPLAPPSPMIRSILDYFSSVADWEENGWDFSIPSNGKAAHAPWWVYDAQGNKLQNIGLSAEICCFILDYEESGSPLYDKALTYSKGLLKKLGTLDQYGEMGINGLIVLLASLDKAGQLGPDEVRKYKEILGKLVQDAIEYDSNKWTSYSVRPSKFIRSRENPFYNENAEILSKELDFLLESRKEVWDIHWNWGEYGTTYAQEYAVSMNWWKSILAIENVLLLRSFDRFSK